MGTANRKSADRPGISQVQFAGLLQTLAQDPLEAGARYEALRTRLIFYFTRRCLDSPEDLADEVLDRLARRLADGTVVESLTGFALGIARFVAQEQASRPMQIQEMDPAFFDNIPADSPTKSVEERLSGMEHCLNRMPAADVELLEKYYLGDGGSLIRARKHLLRTLDASPEALRQRIFSIRRRIRDCMERHRTRASSKPESSFHGK